MVGGQAGKLIFVLLDEKNGTPGALRGPPGPGVLAALRRTGQHSSLAQHHLAHVVPPAALAPTLLRPEPTGPHSEPQVDHVPQRG